MRIILVLATMLVLSCTNSNNSGSKENKDSTHKANDSAGKEFIRKTP